MAWWNKKGETSTKLGPIGSMGLVSFDDRWEPPEFLTELLPPTGLVQYRKMYWNDPVVGGLVFHLRSLVSSLKWRLEGDGPPWVEDCFSSWNGLENLIMDMSLSMVYGFWVGEAIIDSLPSMKDLEPRLQTTIYNITKDNVVQISLKGQATIPAKKCVLFTPLTEARNPWGVSLLRWAYKPWWNKSKIEASELMSIDRDVGGLPVMTAPEDFNFGAAIPGTPIFSKEAFQTLEWAKTVVKNIRSDKIRGLVRPSGWELELLRGDSPQVEEPIQRYNTEICVALLQAFSAMGTFAQRGGSRISNYVDIFLRACDWFASRISKTLETQFFGRWCSKWNQPTPKVVYNRATPVNMKDLASYVARLTSNGVIVPTPELEEALLALVDLPTKGDSEGGNDA